MLIIKICYFPLLVMYPESSVLSSMGVTLCRGPVPLPLYAQKELRPDPTGIPGLAVMRVVDVDPELQSLMSLVLQITDAQAFRR